MYRKHFGLAELPFSIAPDPRYLYMSKHHREALAHLIYGVSHDGGFVLLSGEVGTGKTTVCRCFLEQIPENCDVAFLFNPKLSAEELLAAICDELRIAVPGGAASIKSLVDRLNAHLLDAHARGRRTVLIIDEAQNLDDDVLEQIRLLTNLETNQRKLLQIILLGQPQLRERLARPELRQLSQRIVARYHLDRLSRQDVGAYVAHRLAIARASPDLFPPSLAADLDRLSGGIPRLINVICDRALLGACVQGKHRVDRDTLNRAAREVFGRGKSRLPGPAFGAFAAAGLAAAAGIAYYSYYSGSSELAPVQPVMATQRPTPQVAVAPAAPERPPAASPQAPAQRAVDPPAQALRWPADRPRSRSESLALQSLFRQWGQAVEPLNAADACRRAEASGLRCLAGRSGLEELRRLNRPAVLQLHDEEGEIFHGTLTALHAGWATVVVGGEPQVVAIGALARQWEGNYRLFWQAPPRYREAIRPGTRGPMVEWLSQQVATAQGRSPAAANAVSFDDALLREVKELQLASGLVPDGIVGPHTLIHLETAAGGGSPRLTGGSKDD